MRGRSQRSSRPATATSALDRRWPLLLLAVWLVAAACGRATDDDAAASDPDQPDGGVAIGVVSVFALPPADISELVPYQVYEDEFIVSETASFLVDGLTVDQVVDFYQPHLSDMGYRVSRTDGDDGAVALEVTDPTQASVMAEIDVSPSSLGPSSVVVGQRRTVTVSSEAPPVDADELSEVAPDELASEEISPPEEPPPPLDLGGESVTVRWDQLQAVPEVVVEGEGADQRLRIATDPEVDGFLLVLEFYPNQGQGWTGQTGTFEVQCDIDPLATGICAEFDPDGPGPAEVLGRELPASGTVTITRLDEGGYDLFFDELAFENDVWIGPFTAKG